MCVSPWCHVPLDLCVCVLTDPNPYGLVCILKDPNSNGFTCISMGTNPCGFACVSMDPKPYGSLNLCDLGPKSLWIQGCMSSWTQILMDSCVSPHVCPHGHAVYPHGMILRSCTPTAVCPQSSLSPWLHVPMASCPHCSVSPEPCILCPCTPVSCVPLPCVLPGWPSLPEHIPKWPLLLLGQG